MPTIATNKSGNISISDKRNDDQKLQSAKEYDNYET